MITLNLLDEKRKNNFSLRRVLLTVQKGIELIFFSVLLVGIIFSISQYYLQNSFEQVVSQNTLINRNIDGFHQEILDINYQLKEIDKIQSEYTAWSPLLLNIVNGIPTDIKLHALNIDKEENAIHLTGIAKDRDTLLSLKTNLEELYVVEKVNSPISNLLKKDNIEFEFDLKMNPDRLTYDQ